MFYLDTTDIEATQSRRSPMLQDRRSHQFSTTMGLLKLFELINSSSFVVWTTSLLSPAKLTKILCEQRVFLSSCHWFHDLSYENPLIPAMPDILKGPWMNSRRRGYASVDERETEQKEDKQQCFSPLPCSNSRIPRMDRFLYFNPARSAHSPRLPHHPMPSEKNIGSQPPTSTN